MIMNLLASIRSAREVLDGLFTLASLICVPALSGMGVMWAMDSSTGVKVGGSSYVVSAAPGEEAEIPIPWSSVNNSTTLTYRLKLVNQMDTVVHDYPEVITTSERSPEFGNLMFRIPQRVPSGDYKLVADVTYPKNPLKTGVIQIELAQINVSR